MISIILDEGVELPKYETDLASGLDIRAVKVIKAISYPNEYPNLITELQNSFNKDGGKIALPPFSRTLFGTGITVADMPKNAEIQVRPRSGLSLNKGLLIANSPGTIDADYRGEIGIIIYNSTSSYVEVNKNDRIAQIVTAYVDKIPFGITTEIIPTERGDKGYNSTGTN